MRALLLALILTQFSCGDDDEPSRDRDARADAEFDARADAAVDARAEAAADARTEVGPTDVGSDVAPTGEDASAPSPECEAVRSNGSFPTCAACDAAGRGCDEIDTPSGSGYVCDCGSSADCPCGLRCGSLEIGPGVSVSDICTR